MQNKVTKRIEHGNTIVEEHYSDGSIKWNKNGRLHREDGPALIEADGGQSWFKNGKLHRDNGPAEIEADGRHAWFKNGVLHREDGPAYEEFLTGFKEWYINGKDISESQFNALKLNKELEKTLPIKYENKKFKKIKI